MSSALAPLAASYYENFLESLAQIVSKLLTDKETEAVLTSIRSFQDKLKRLSSQNLSRLRLELAHEEKKGLRLCKHEGKTCTQNCTRGFVKAFVVAFSVKYLIAILPPLLTGKVFKRPGILKQMVDRDTACFALFLSTFLSSYKGILCGLRRLNSKDDRLNAFVAGSIAGSALILDRDKRRRQSIMLYLLTRSLQFSGAWLMKQWAIHRQAKRRKDLAQLKEDMDHKGFQPNEPRELVVKKKWDDHLAKFMQRWAGVGVMILANAQIIYAFLLDPDTVPKAYYAFLLSHSGWKGNFGNMASPLAHVIGDTIRRLADEGGSIQIPGEMTSREFVAETISPNIATIIPPKMKHKYILCALQHPLEESCVQNKVTMFRTEYLRALKLYMPLNIIMTIVFRSGQMTTNPMDVLRKFAMSCMRSALFLSMYVTMGFSTPCATRPILEKERHWMYMLTGAVAGTMTFIEARGRQLELGLYCLPRAIESYWKTLVKYGYVRSIPNGEILLFMASMGTLMTLYQNEKDTINSHYLSVMTRFFGHN
ncbi:hypothetical protein DFQ28_003628 [Apophysomyces sp. BC1034]|nr:hypothetical protein DFQ30_001847 [Apophysomyces sp. BC1015]KAG0182899.1 hypothetical protein DFQ29_001337 [Apophysomyces sp. BC1021]KAG0193708.1 hypothetical protein DFQ28_003628 [Apophysomyces sp. BC1034]